MAEKNTAEQAAPKSASQQALAREVLARRVRNATDTGILTPKMRRGIERMQENIGKVGN